MSSSVQGQFSVGQRLEGTVKWFNADKGYGFIQVEGSDVEFFVHYSEIVGQVGYRQLTQGNRVDFFVGRTEKGLCAEAVEEFQDDDTEE